MFRASRLEQLDEQGYNGSDAGDACQRLDSIWA